MLVCLAAIPLGGCMQEQAMKSASCTLEALNHSFGKSPISRPDVEHCMRVQGYVMRTSKYCNYPADETKAVCYQPDDRLGQLGYQLEMALFHSDYASEGVRAAR